MNQRKEAEKARQRTIVYRHNARQEIIERYKLNEEDTSRMSAMIPGDPVSDYYGQFELQAEIIDDEKRVGATEQIGSVAVDQAQTGSDSPPTS